jgi:hypothetical protein
MSAAAFENAGMSGADFAKCQANGAGHACAYTLLRDLRPNLTSRDIVRGALPFGGVGVAYAEPGAGKTAILVDMGLHVAAGMEYRKRRVEQQPVIYVALEGHGGIDNRIIAAAAHLGLEDVPFALVKAGDNFRDPASARKVAAVARQLGGSPLIMVDTLTAALAGGSDCDPKDVGQLLDNLKVELVALGYTVLIIHHTGKDASRGARGWSGLLAAVDFEFEISRDGDLRSLRISKMRDGSDSQPAFCYELEAHQLGVNQHGDPITAVVVEHLVDEDAAKRGKRLSPKARAALNVLWEMIKDRSKSFALADQPGLRCVLASAWETECSKPGAICKCHEERDRRKKFRAAKDELAAAGSIVCDGGDAGRVYPAPKERPGQERDGFAT